MKQQSLAILFTLLLIACFLLALGVNQRTIGLEHFRRGGGGQNRR